jgi:hypothetical protein
MGMNSDRKDVAYLGLFFHFSFFIFYLPLSPRNRIEKHGAFVSLV